VNGVAAEISIEIRVLFQHCHIHAGAGEKESSHQTGWSAADNDTPVMLG